jgi:hypothetical protein
MLFAIAGVATAFNFIIIYVKYRRQRYVDCGLDLLAAILLVSIFANAGQGGIVIAMIASAIVSLFLLFARSN